MACIGETLEERERGDTLNVCRRQLQAIVNCISPADWAKVVIAYEPVWAIGTGRTASPAQAAEMHAAIRRWLSDTYGALGADRSILYGGSVKPDNAGELLAMPDIDGALVGGASLDAASFAAILEAASTAGR